MSKIEVNQVDPQSGTTLTLGTSGDTISIPAGVTLANSGTATGFASIAWQSTIVTTSTLTAVAGNGYWIDTTLNACTVTLPGSASVGDQLIFSDYARTWGTNKIIIDSNGLNYQGDPDTLTVEYNTNGQSVNIVYSGATKGWIPVSDDDVTDAPIVPPYDIDFLVVAGGASGGADDGGGGGAGGYRTSTQTDIALGTVITVTVGDGGAAVGQGTHGNNGSDSSISGSSLTTITSAGGGGGGFRSDTNNNTGRQGASGGSGGGGAINNAGTSGGTGGSGNTPSVAPSQGNDGGTAYGASPYGGGGGGGASQVGGNAPAGPGGAGGDGTANSITGPSVTYAGGGGGATRDVPAGGGSGGAGGGGVGGAGPGVDGGDGTANTGGGGGGASLGGSANSGAGGKGVVILSMLDGSYSGTTTGSPTVATGVSGKTVLTFTGSGSYTT
jgi:hypothetical protein